MQSFIFLPSAISLSLTTAGKMKKSGHGAHAPRADTYTSGFFTSSVTIVMVDLRKIMG
jgi:hypothetical protein